MCVLMKNDFKPKQVVGLETIFYLLSPKETSIETQKMFASLI